MLTVKVENLYLWCPDTLREPGGPFGVFVWDSQILYIEVVHEFLFLGVPRKEELMGTRAREEDSWICVGATGWYFCNSLLLPSMRPWGLAGQTPRLLPC